jgi:predicted Zn finger-like uncharacterized protein
MVSRTLTSSAQTPWQDQIGVDAMAIRCPKCRTPSLLSASEVGEAGRLVRCAHCSTTWLARHFAATAYGPMRRETPPPVTPRQPLIIDGEIAGPTLRSTTFGRPRPVEPPPPSPSTPAFASARRYGFAAAAAALVMTLIAVVLLAPGVAALPGILAGKGVVLEDVASKTVALHGGEAILIEGAIVNRSGRAMDVPAVRVALRSGGTEVYSWLIEPTVARVAAGRSVGFRSALASPMPGASQIALSLAGRGEDR